MITHVKPSDKKISAHCGLFCKASDWVGVIDYTSYNCFEERPQIDNLSVFPNFRCQGIGTQLITRAVSDLQQMMSGQQEDIYFVALPDESVDISTLVTFYENRGAKLVWLSIDCALMKFTCGG